VARYDRLRSGACSGDIDSTSTASHNYTMSTATLIPADVMSRMQEAAANATNGVRDPDEMRKACDNMDRISEEIRRRHGILDIGVRAIRELRDA
jgi:hypothetical protein